MKILVNFIQIMLIAGMVYPVYAVWNNDQINNFCTELKTNMTKQRLFDLADEKNITVSFDNVDALKWFATASVSAHFSNYSCQIRGMGDRVASATLAVR